MVLVVTLTLPVVAGGVGQVTEYATRVVSPTVTVTLRERAPLTVQFPATPPNVTEWLPAGRPLNVTLSWTPIG